MSGYIKNGRYISDSPGNTEIPCLCEKFIIPTVESFYETATIEEFQQKFLDDISAEIVLEDISENSEEVIIEQQQITEEISDE